MSDPSPRSSDSGVHPRGRIRFQDLMRHRVDHILLVSNLYDSFTVAEDGRLNEALVRAYGAMNLTQTPDITRVTTGRQALELLADQGRFDLVLTDWNMPGKNGLEVIAEIRQQDAEVPIIMVTTEAEKSRVLEAIQAGVSDYLVKPFTADMLREKLEKHGC